MEKSSISQIEFALIHEQLMEYKVKYFESEELLNKCTRDLETERGKVKAFESSLEKEALARQKLEVKLRKVLRMGDQKIVAEIERENECLKEEVRNLQLETDNQMKNIRLNMDTMFRQNQKLKDELLKRKGDFERSDGSEIDISTKSGMTQAVEQVQELQDIVNVDTGDESHGSFDSSNGLVNSLREDNLLLKKKNSKLEHDLDRVVRKLADSEVKVKNLVDVNNVKQREISRLLDGLKDTGSIVNNVQSLKDHNAELLYKNDSFRKLSNELKAQLDERNTEVRKLKMQEMQLKTDFEELESHYHVLEKEIKDLDDMKMTLNELDKKYSKLQRYMIVLKEENRLQKSSLDQAITSKVEALVLNTKLEQTLFDHLKKSSIEMKSLQKEHTSIVSSLEAELRTFHSKKAAQKTKFQFKIGKLNQRNLENSICIEDLQHKVKSLNDINGLQEFTIKQLECELQEKNSVIEKLDLSQIDLDNSLLVEAKKRNNMVRELRKHLRKQTFYCKHLEATLKCKEDILEDELFRRQGQNHDFLSALSATRSFGVDSSVSTESLYCMNINPPLSEDRYYRIGLLDREVSTLKQRITYLEETLQKVLKTLEEKQKIIKYFIENAGIDLLQVSILDLDSIDTPKREQIFFKMESMIHENILLNLQLKDKLKQAGISLKLEKVTSLEDVECRDTNGLP